MDDAQDLETDNDMKIDFSIFQTILASDQFFSNFKSDETRTDVIPNTEEEAISTFVCEVLYEEKSKERFEEACVDSGAQRIVIGKRQAQLHCEPINEQYCLSNSDSGNINILEKGI